jgi:hypothetical protein
MCCYVTLARVQREHKAWVKGQVNVSVRASLAMLVAACTSKRLVARSVQGFWGLKYKTIDFSSAMYEICGTT